MPIFGQVWLWSLASFVVGGLLTGVLLVRPARRRIAYLERTVSHLRESEFEWESDSDSADDRDELLEFEEHDGPRDRAASRADYLQSAGDTLDDRRDRFSDDFFDDPEPEPTPEPQATPGDTTVLSPVRGDLESPPELSQPRITPAVTSRMEEQSRPTQGSTVISRGRIQPVGRPKTGVDWFDPDYDPDAPNAGQRPQPPEQRPVPVEPRPVPVEPMPVRKAAEPPVNRRGERGTEQSPPVPSSSGLSGRLDGEQSESMRGVLTPPAEEEAPETQKPAARPIAAQPEPSRPMAAARQQAPPRRPQRDEEPTQIIPVITDETPAPEPAAPAKSGEAPRTATARRATDAPQEKRGYGGGVQVETRPADYGRADAKPAGEPALGAPAQSEGRALFEPMVPPPAEEKPDTSTDRVDGSAGQQDGQVAAPGPFGPGSAMPNPGGGSPSPEFTVKASVTALRYCTEESPEFSRIVAEVWFKSTADAQRVGFRPLA